jgi:hypothetical protein
MTEIRLRKRPFLIRVRNAYRIYRVSGLSRWQSLRFALEINSPWL